MPDLFTMKPVRKNLIKNDSTQYFHNGIGSYYITPINSTINFITNDKFLICYELLMTASQKVPANTFVVTRDDFHKIYMKIIRNKYGDLFPENYLFDSNILPDASDIDTVCRWLARSNIYWSLRLQKGSFTLKQIDTNPYDQIAH